MANIYPHELILKKTTESFTVVSYLDIRIMIVDGQFITSIYDKRDDFNFRIVNFPFMNSNIPTTPAYGIYISQLVRMGRICDNYQDFIHKNKEVTTRLIKQGFRFSKLCKCFKKFNRRYSHLFNKYNITLRKHIEDGICRPLCGLPMLSKHVTVRSVHRR